MPRRRRDDQHGALHHVMNRGIAKRTMFERREDMRYFTSLIARCVHRGEIRVLAYCIMQTHYHLIVQSRHEKLAEAMQWIQSMYTRYFNRTRDRDGPLVRGRFTSRLIESQRYAAIARLYVEANPVDAGLVDDPVEYEFSSASLARWRHQRVWLSRDRAPRWGVGLTEEDRRSLDYLARESVAAGGQIDRLLSLTPDELPGWFKENSLLADGTVAGAILCSPNDIGRTLDALSPRLDALRPPSTIRRVLRLRDSVHVTLLYALSGLTQSSIAQHLDLSRTTVSSILRRSKERMRRWPELHGFIVEAATQAFRQSAAYRLGRDLEI